MATLAPTPAPTDAAPRALHAALATVCGHLERAAALVPAARWAERPAPGTRTFLQLVGHVADGHEYYARHARGEEVAWAETIEHAVRTPDEAMDAMRRAAARLLDATAAPGVRVAPVVDALAHASLHYGNAATQLRTMGLVPPSSE